MKLTDFRPLYFHELDLRVGELRVQRLALNRHLPEKDWVRPHRHAFAQFLLYLTGRGWQQVAGQNHAVRPGSLFLLARGVEHAFIEVPGRRPLCLALDLHFPRGKGGKSSQLATLTRSELHRVRHALAALTRWQADEVAVEPREAGAVLQILDTLLRAVGELRRDDPSPGMIARRVREALEAEESAPLAGVARKLGYHPDHLNRLLRQTTGMSMSEFRDEIRLRKAKTSLRQSRLVGDAAWESGFSDPNYFSRWFRAQTGLTPGAWRRQSAQSQGCTTQGGQEP